MSERRTRDETWTSWGRWYVAVSYVIAGLALSAGGAFVASAIRRAVRGTSEVDRDVLPDFTLVLADQPLLAPLLGVPAIVVAIILLFTVRCRVMWHSIAIVTLLFGLLLIIGGFVGLIAPLYQIDPGP